MKWINNFWNYLQLFCFNEYCCSLTSDFRTNTRIRNWICQIPIRVESTFILITENTFAVVLPQKIFCSLINCFTYFFTSRSCLYWQQRVWVKKAIQKSHKSVIITFGSSVNEFTFLNTRDSRLLKGIFLILILC